MSWRRGFCCTAAFLALSIPCSADRLRVATFNTELQRSGPGLLLRDIESGQDVQINAVVRVIADISPDILAIQGFDWDHEGIALSSFIAMLRSAGAEYPHHIAMRPNSGLATQLDMDGDGVLGNPGDAQGFGVFSGQGGMAILSRHPIRSEHVQDFSALLWKDVPGALLPVHSDGAPFPSEEAQAVQRLSNVGHWIVPFQLPNGKTLQLATFHASPPVFDGPEDQNGRRNHDEIWLWRFILDGQLGHLKPPFVIAGVANLDPFDSDGKSEAIRQLIKDPRLQDPNPQSKGAALAPDQEHIGDNAQDTVDWDGPGRLRVDYVLPSSDASVENSGVYWPAIGEAGHENALAASRHRLVWVDLILD